MERVLAEYVSAFRKWDTASSVRSKPLRVMEDGEAFTGLFFSPELVPVVHHPLVAERGPDITEQILIHHLYNYLDFTENLEHEVVNQIAFKIGRRKLDMDLPQDMVADAWKLYVDEAYHYMFSADLVQQVERMTGVEVLRRQQPLFLVRLQRILADVPQELRELVLVFFTIVSETLITGTMSVVPKDLRVVQTVRDVIADHAEDEYCHHAYFANLLNHLWVRLTPAQQSSIGPLLPELITGFLEPDTDVVKGWLHHLNFTAKETEIIIEETYARDKVMAAVRDSAKVTLKHLERNAVFEEPRTEEAFWKSGLLTAK